jgi:LDH2 family malate/lactate/ureidoglycolate dehydrogenase|tara:strand:- start:196 stop:429 length:234 start_codon:yes stop_codon:yes gene_type:complete
LSKINLEVADNLEFEHGDIAITIKPDGTIGKIIMPKMDEEIRNTEGYRKMLDVVEVLQPGAKEEFIKHDTKEKGSVH